MNTLNTLEVLLKNKKFSIDIKGLNYGGDSETFTISVEYKSLRIHRYAKDFLEYGFLKDINIVLINSVRNEFNIGYKEKYDSDKKINDILSKKIEEEVLMSIYQDSIIDIILKHREGILWRIELITKEGLNISFKGIECYNEVISEEALAKFNV